MPVKFKIRKKRITSPIIFVLSGPGGVGKTTLLNLLFRKKIIQDNFLRAISFTTRKKRPQELNGKDYFFVSKVKFLNLKRKKALLESQKILEDHYGTPKHFYSQAKKTRKDLILCIDVKGGMYLKENRKLDKIVTIFVTIGKKELYQRLRKRAETKNIIKKRINLAKKELLFYKDYDYLVVNRNIKATLKKLEKIFLAKRTRRDNE